MKTRRASHEIRCHLTCAIILGLVLRVSASADPGAHIQHLNFDPHSRQAQLAENTLRSELKRLHRDMVPWRWVIVHNIGDWQKIRWRYPEPKTNAALSLLEARTTYLNGHIFLDLPQQSRLCIDHEIAHQVFWASQKYEEEMQNISSRWASSYPREIDLSQPVPAELASARSPRDFRRVVVHWKPR